MDPRPADRLVDLRRADDRHAVGGAGDGRRPGLRTTGYAEPTVSALESRPAPTGWRYQGNGIATAQRVSQKTRRCGCGGVISAGDRYLMHKEFPGHDAGYADAAGHPVEMPECGACARRYGRGWPLDGA